MELAHLKLLMTPLWSPMVSGSAFQISDTSITGKCNIFIYETGKMKMYLESPACYTEIHWTRIENFLSLALTPAHMQYGNKQVRFLIHEMRWFIVLSSHVNAKHSFPCKMPWIWNVTKITVRGKKRLCSKVFCLELKWHILINDG